MLHAFVPPSRPGQIRTQQASALGAALACAALVFASICTFFERRARCGLTTERVSLGTPQQGHSFVAGDRPGFRRRQCSTGGLALSAAIRLRHARTGRRLSDAWVCHVERTPASCERGDGRPTQLFFRDLVERHHVLPGTWLGFWWRGAERRRKRRLVGGYVRRGARQDGSQWRGSANACHRGRLPSTRSLAYPWLPRPGCACMLGATPRMRGSGLTPSLSLWLGFASPCMAVSACWAQCLAGMA